MHGDDSTVITEGEKQNKLLVCIFTQSRNSKWIICCIVNKQLEVQSDDFTQRKSNMLLMQCMLMLTV